MAEPVVNQFVHRDAAAHYAQDRPRFHGEIIARLRERLHLAAPLPNALDVGCGTGHSAVALREIAARVTAVDVSAAMLAEAPAVEGVVYRQGPAEALPCADGEFPLLTAGMAFHWFDRPRFLAEAARVLQPDGWLVLYGYHFTKRVPGCPGFTAWFEGDYFRRYPLTPRHGEPVTPAEVEPHGLRWRERTEYVETRPYVAAALARMLLTHSNVIRAVNDGRETFAAAGAWLTGELARRLGAGPREIEFSGWMTLIQKAAPPA